MATQLELGEFDLFGVRVARDITLNAFENLLAAKSSKRYTTNGRRLFLVRECENPRRAIQFDGHLHAPTDPWLPGFGSVVGGGEARKIGELGFE